MLIFLYEQTKIQVALVTKASYLLVLLVLSSAPGIDQELVSSHEIFLPTDANEHL